MPICDFGVQVCWSHLCSTCNEWDGFLNARAEAEHWLSRFPKCPLVSISLHEICREFGYQSPNRLSDDDAISAIAPYLASGWLRACNHSWDSTPGGLTSVASSTGGTSPENEPPAPAKPSDLFVLGKAFPLADRKLRAPSPTVTPSETELLTFAEDLNVPKQVRTMQTAAARASAFCALCGPVPAGAATVSPMPLTMPAPPKPQETSETQFVTFAEDLDIQNQVLTMRTAALQGLPFCPICSQASANNGI